MTSLLYTEVNDVILTLCTNIENRFGLNILK